MSLLLNILAPEMDEDTVRIIRRGVTIVAQSRLEWPKSRAKLKRTGRREASGRTPTEGSGVWSLPYPLLGECKMTQAHPDISQGELLVLLTVREINDRNLMASDATILAILDLAPVVTGIDLGCPEILTPDAIERACRRLETLGYMSDKDISRARESDDTPADEAPAPHSLTAEEVDSFGQAIRFSAEVTAELSREQYEAVFTLVLCRTVGRWEGWFDEETDLIEMVRDKLPESLVEAERGLLIAETMKEIWERDKAT